MPGQGDSARDGCPEGTVAVYATPGRRETMHRAMAAVLAEPEWWSLPTDKATWIAMRATGGAAIPVDVAREFHEMRRERGVVLHWEWEGRDERW